MRFALPSALPLLLAASFSVSAERERFLELNLGLAPSKSVLGLSYTEGANQFNAGIKNFWVVGSRGYMLQPGITYNRYLTSNGFYASATYAPFYIAEQTYGFRFVGPDSNDYVVEEQGWEKGWHIGDLFLGGGKSFQFTHWGLHVDGGFITPAGEGIARYWGYWIGAGLSYRFKLD